MTILKFIAYICGLILMAIVGYNSGYVNGSSNAIESFNDWRKSFYARYETNDKDWIEAYKAMDEDWNAKYKETVENYERQIKILKQMLEKERGEK